MDIFINERSFNGQAQYHNARELLDQFARTLMLLRTICSDAEVVIHSSFSSRPFLGHETINAWLSREDDSNNDEVEDEFLDEDLGDAPALQQFVTLVLAALSRGPYLEDLLAEHPHLCYLENIDHEGSSLAAAACLQGAVISLGHQFTYPDHQLRVRLILNDSEQEVIVPHFITVATARLCRRRYVPNPKHHPARATGNVAKMELDLVYDPFTEQKKLELYHPDKDMPDTPVQRLLDRALSNGSQLYARTYHHPSRTEIFYEFQNDNMNGFHGYPVPTSEVSASIIRKLREQ